MHEISNSNRKDNRVENTDLEQGSYLPSKLLFTVTITKHWKQVLFTINKYYLEFTIHKYTKNYKIETDSTNLRLL